MRKVLANHKMVAHVWANQSQSEGKANNMFFEGDTIYSYGYHFKIARFYTHNDKTCVLFNSDSYSVSTSKHQSYTMSAIDTSVYDVFTVPDLDPSGDHSVNKKHFIDTAAEITKKLKRARTWIDLYVTDLNNIISDSRKYAEFFGLDWNINSELSPEQLNKLLEKQKEAEKLREQRKIAKAKEFAEKWLRGEINHFNGHAIDTLLRVKDDKVQTSHGAEVPIEHARRIFPIIKRCRDNHSTYQRNGHSEHIGHFTVDKIDDKGNMKVGCHFIKWDQIEKVSRIIL